MEIKEVIGIDASKLTLDCCVHTSGGQEVFYNTSEGISMMVDWSFETSCMSMENLLFFQKT